VREKIYNRIFDLLENSYYVPKGNISESAVYDSLELDSLVLLEISVILNKEFYLNIKDGDLLPTMKIGESINVILQKEDCAT
jgi:acyl carrier protein